MSAHQVSRFILLIACGGALFWGQNCAAPKGQWYKGNLHTHTLWSDGDDFPEMVIDWYKSHNYHFLALSDHNVLQEGDTWVPVAELRDGAAVLEKYRRRFGENWVEVRTVDGEEEVRLKTFKEFKPLFEESGRFAMILGEEITANFDDIPLHVNASNLVELIPPQGGESVVETIRNNVRAVLQQREATGQPMIPHLNHPNWKWAVTTEELLEVDEEQFFEVYNGSTFCYNYGDSTHVSTDRMWDILLTKRIAERGTGVIYGVSVDDSHHYHDLPDRPDSPGRGWIVVRAEELTPEAIIQAMEAGDFYASNGVRLKDIRRTRQNLTVVIDAEPGVAYTTQFIGTRLGYDPASKPFLDENGEPVRVTWQYDASIGEVLAEVQGVRATYRYNGDEIYVRAKILSTKLMPNPSEDGEVELAWTQPVLVAGAGK